MNDNEDLARIREICDLAHDITQGDKLYLRKLSIDYSVKFDDCRRCPNKWRDLAIELYSKMHTPEDAGTDCQFELKPEISVLFKERIVNNATMTDELGYWLLKYHFPKRWFVRLPEECK